MIMEDLLPRTRARLGVALLTLALAGCAPPPDASGPAASPPPEPSATSQIANPAATNCLDRGGKLVPVRTAQGEGANCVLPDGSTCEEWALFRGECPAAKSTATPAPSPTVEPEATRIAFASGGTDYYRDGKLSAGEIRTYVLWAKKGQNMDVDVDSPEENVSMTIYGVSDGVPLVRSASGATRWNGELPESQDYIVKVVGPANPTSYLLLVSIPAQLEVPPGAKSTVVRGRTQGVTTYTVNAKAGQRLSARVSSPTSDVILSIHGVDDGVPFVTLMTDAMSWSGTVGATQEYALSLVATTGPSDYELTVSLE